MVRLTILNILFHLCLSFANLLEEADIALLTLGNTGVGKSFVDNILIGKKVFDSSFSARSVTRLTEYQMVQVEDKKMAIFNIPGLLELSDTNIELNKKEIQKAFSGKPGQVILYIFGQSNGRIRGEDIETFRALNEAYQFNSNSIIFVVNQVPQNPPSDYEAVTFLIIKEVLQWPDPNIIFIEQLDDKVAETLNSTKVQGIRNHILSVILDATPFRHTAQKPIVLNKDKIKEFDEVLRRLMKEMVEKDNKYQHQIAELTNRWKEEKEKSAQFEKQVQEGFAKNSGKKKKWWQHVINFVLEGPVVKILREL